VPLYKRADIEIADADAIGKGLDSMAKCLSDFEGWFAGKEHHKDWLRGLKEALADDDTDGEASGADNAVERRG